MGEGSIPATAVAIIVATVGVVGHVGGIGYRRHALNALHVGSWNRGIGVARGEGDNG